MIRDPCRIALFLAAGWMLAACAAGAGTRNSPPAGAESTVAGDCGRAYAACVGECRVARDLFDFQRNRRIDTFRTSYFDGCVESCRMGSAACGTVGRDDAGDAFAKACTNTCPTFIWDGRLGDYLTTTEAATRCGDACEAGAEALHRN